MDSPEHSKYHEDNLRRIKQLRIMDDIFMTKFFEDSPECTEFILRIILDMPDLKVIEVHTQYSIKNLQGRSARLDILAVDSKGKYYNIEIQRDNKGAKPKRVRYNISMIDANILLPGDDTDELPEIYVIFITENDVLGLNEPVYHIDRTIKESGAIFGDEAHILYVNGARQDETPLGKLMHDFSCPDPAEMHYELLAERSRYFKEDEKGSASMSSIADELRKEGEEIGSRDRCLKNVIELMKNLNWTIEQAMDAISLSEEDRLYVKSQI